MIADGILIIFISFCTAFLGEALTWVMVYRTDKYKKLKAEVEKQSKKLEKQKEVDSTERSAKKKIACLQIHPLIPEMLLSQLEDSYTERQEERLKTNSRDLSLVKMKSMFAIGFAFTALLSMFNSIFDGRVVAKLPFTPISLLQGISHRNLAGDDYTDCSFIFLYILCTMFIRQKMLICWPRENYFGKFTIGMTGSVVKPVTSLNVQKVLGLAPSRAASKQGTGLFGSAPQWAQK